MAPYPAANAAARQEIGARLRVARQRAGLRQRDLASGLGITQAAVSLMEAGQRGTTRYRQTIATLLGDHWDAPGMASENGKPPGSHPGGHPAPIDNGETMGSVQQHSATGTPAAHRTTRTGVQA